MQLKDYPLSVFEEKYKEEKDIRVRERLQMLFYRRKGYTQREVSSLLSVSIGIVPFWENRFRRDGFDGIPDREGRGLKSKLTNEQLSMLASAIEEGILLDDGYRRGFKTKDVVEFITTSFELKYTARHCRRILQSFDCSLLVPRPRNKRRNEQEVKKFKQEFKKNEKFWVMT